ncbi:unnamed protein product [Cuscuta epithymum]|uniref:GATA-type domain-containing protein n=2 Tax=Cuscuta epithymum TaxID=186058 RepID=A0AAV0FRJ6_9ASTE|nr:unnamed protein product [Cuscuta epithymum]
MFGLSENEKMNTPGGNYWKGNANGANGHDIFYDLLSIVDFPMESLEGEGSNEGGDTVPSEDAYIDMYPFPQAYFQNGSLEGVFKNAYKEESTPQENQVLNLVEDPSGGAPAPLTETSSEETILINSDSSILFPDFLVPVRKRSKRTRSPNVNRWSLIAPIFCTSAPSRNTSVLSGIQMDPPSPKKMKKRVLSWKSIPVKHGRGPGVNGSVRECTHCHVKKTPQWREGPLGPNTLCNACGVRYRTGRLFPEYRPAASPTFIPSVHSNLHREVLRKRGQL